MHSHTHVCIGYAQLYVGVSIYAHFLRFFFLLLKMAFSRPKNVAGGNTLQRNRVCPENSAFVSFILFCFLRFDTIYTVRCNTVRSADLTGEPERSLVTHFPVNWKFTRAWNFRIPHCTVMENGWVVVRHRTQVPTTPFDFHQNHYFLRDRMRNVHTAVFLKRSNLRL